MRLAALFAFAALTAVLAVGLLASAGHAAPAGWHTSMKEGLEASGKSGKPLLVVTAWKEKV